MSAFDKAWDIAKNEEEDLSRHLSHIFEGMRDAGHWGQLGLPHNWDEDEMRGWIGHEREQGNLNFPFDYNFQTRPDGSDFLGYAWKEGVVSPEEAVQICEDGGCVWLKDWAEENYGSEEHPHYDYPTEDPDDIRMWIEEGMFDGPDAPIILTDPAGSFGRDE